MLEHAEHGHKLETKESKYPHMHMSLHPMVTLSSSPILKAIRPYQAGRTYNNVVHAKFRVTEGMEIDAWTGG
jgi:hypothetical protein